MSCKTRGERSLDLLYANVKDAFSSFPLPPLGRSDDSLFSAFDPLYMPLAKRQPEIMKTVTSLSEEAYEELQACFEVK